MDFKPLARTSKFSYICNNCGQCCRSLAISVNPYDIARLAAYKNMSTTKFIRLFVNKKHWTLTRHEDGSCVFLGESGCSVHPDRPLPCRLYPLARNRSTTGKESLALLPPESESTGEYGQTGTVEDYLRSQEIDEHTRFADRYFQFFAELLSRLRLQANDKDRLRDLTLEALPVMHQLLSHPDRARLIEPLMDMDKGIEEDCLASDALPPDTLISRTERHLAAIHAQMDGALL